MKHPVVALSLLLMTAVSQGQFCPSADGPCRWYDRVPSGLPCWTSEARCNSESAKCTGNQAISWLCVQSCQGASGCYAVAKCILGHNDYAPCLEHAPAIAGNCDGSLLPITVPPLRFGADEAAECERAANASRSGRTGCPSADSGTRFAAPSGVSVQEVDPCEPDPNGAKRACFHECMAASAAGAGEYCAPPDPSEPVDNCRAVCQLLWSPADCNSVCSCKQEPPPGPSACRKPSSDVGWMDCGDVSKGGSDECVWCQKDHDCKPTGGEHFPMGYDPACGEPAAADLGKAVAFLPAVSSQQLCTFACSDGTSLFRCMLDSCPDTYSGCQRADSYSVSSERCNNLAIYFYKSGGARSSDRQAGHESVASNAMLTVTKKILKQRQSLLQRGVTLDPVSPEEIAQGIAGLEVKGLGIAEEMLCNGVTQGAATDFCGFILNTEVVQWVNQKMISLPVVGQVTHQIATLASGAIKKGEELVQGAVHAVAEAAMAALPTLVDTCKRAASSIVHFALNFFNWMARAVFATVTGERGPIGLVPPVPPLQKGINCWKCPCGGMGCGDQCILDRQPAQIGICPSGEFIEDADTPQPQTCNTYCQSSVSSEAFQVVV